MSYETTMRTHMDRLMTSNGPIGDNLARLYAGTDLQLGIALSVARGVWHWNANGPQTKGRRYWQVEAVVAELRRHDAIRVLDPDNVLGLSGGSGVRRVSADDYMEAARELALSVRPRTP